MASDNPQLCSPARDRSAAETIAHTACPATSLAGYGRALQARKGGNL